MLTPSKKTFYALEAVLFIAYNAKTKAIAANDVAAAQGKPTRYLEPMLQKLVRAGILKSVRGPTGGYQLGRERRNITLSDICRVIVDGTLPTCETALGEKILKPAATDAIQQWLSSLASITLADLCEKALRQNVATANAIPTDFII